MPHPLQVKLPAAAAPAAKGGGLKVKLHLGGSRPAGPTSEAEAQRLATAAKVPSEPHAVNTSHELT